MVKMKQVVWGWCVLMALVSLVLPTSGQGCTEDLTNKVTMFSTANLKCNPYPVGSSQYYIWALKDNATQATSMVVAVPLTTGNWAGLGFSADGLMVGSTALIATLNTSNGAAATVYNLKGKSSAAVTVGTGFSFVGASGAETYFDSTSGYVYMSYQVDLATSTPANAGFLIMAHGAVSGTTLQQHTDYLSVPGNFVTGGVAGPSAASKLDKKKKIHGSLNILGWGLLLPIGAMVARYARCFDPAWFYTHIAFQILGYGCIIAGVVTGVDIAKQAQAVDQLNAHRGLGIFLLVLASLQVLAVALRPKKDAKVRKYWNWYHHWVGRLALFLAVVNIFVGLHMADAERDFKVSYISILSIELGAFVILEILLWLRWNRKRKSQPAPQEDPEFQFGGNV